MARDEGDSTRGERKAAVAEVRRYRRGAQWGLGGATACLFLVTALLVSMFSADGWNAPMIVLAAGMTVITVGAGLLTGASVWNTVRVRVIAGDVVIESGPVPWTRRRVLQGAGIEQLYVQQAPLEKSFVPRLGGPCDVKARLSDGRWVTIVRGCRSEHDAHQVETIVERALGRENEYAQLEDDERSEIFSNWRASLKGRPPGWLRIEQGDSETRIVCRKSTPVIAAAIATTAPWVAMGAYVVVRGPSAYGVVVWSLLAVVALLVLMRTLLWRQVLVSGPDHVSRRTRGLFGLTRPYVIDRSMIESIDCRSRTEVRRMRNLGRWRVRRYDIVVCNAKAGLLPLLSGLTDLGGVLHVVNALASTLDVPVRAWTGGLTDPDAAPHDRRHGSP